MKLLKFTKLTDYEGNNDKCRKIFLNNYIEDANGNRVVIKTANNERVIFHEFNYDHSFSYKKNPHSLKRVFSYQRARRVLWIKEMVTGNNIHAVRKDIKQDVFFYDQKEKYVVILRKLKNGNLQFITHYCIKYEKALKKLEKKVLT
ncbi:MAG: hypothetical protein KAH35_03750 [Candidatus Atribacteria bacterium]|nr:hypothetical protein [Candidatus Atribacteria bacterium]